VPYQEDVDPNPIAQGPATESIRVLVRLLLLAVQTRDFVLQQARHSTLADRMTWRAVYRAQLGRIAQLECDLAQLMPSGTFTRERPLPKP